MDTNLVVAQVQNEQTVVSNDPACAHPANPKACNDGTSALAKIEQLVIEAQVWHDTVFTTSNEQLYKILAKCYDLYLQMADKNDEIAAKAVRTAFQDFLNLKGYKFGKATHTLNKIVKCVFGFDRRRVNAYGTVLQVALAQGLTPEQLPPFIRDKGGVEEIRLSATANGMTAKQKAEAVVSTLKDKQLGVVASDQLAAMLDAGKIGEQTLLIGTWQANGTIAVQALVESATVLNAALAAHYQANKDELQAANRALEQQSHSSQVAKTAEAAVQSTHVIHQ